LYALLTVSLVLGLSSRITCSHDIRSRSTVRASDTLTRSLAYYKFATYLITDDQLPKHSVTLGQRAAVNQTPQLLTVTMISWCCQCTKTVKHRQLVHHIPHVKLVTDCRRF